MKKLILFFIALFFAAGTYAADYYWVGGSGKWSELNHWSKTSGGAPDHSIIPNLSDDVYFDANSGLANGSLVELPTASPAYCRNMSWAGVTAAVNFIFRGQPLRIYGNLEMAASVRYGTQGINFVGGGTATLKMNGAQRYPAAGWYNPISIDKPGGSLTLLDGIPEGLVVTAVTLVAGSLDMSDLTHSFVNFTGTGTNTRSLDISNATIIASGTFDFRGTNNTINTTNSYISAGIFHSDRFTFPKVDITVANSNDMVINNTTFGQLTFTSTTGQDSQLRIGANNTVDRLEFKSGGAIVGGGNIIKDLYIAPSNPGFVFAGNNRITGTLHANTPDCDALSQIRGSGAGATITFGPGAVADVRNVLMSNLAAAGSIALPISVTGVDGGGNTGWSFQPRATGTTLYWVGGAGDWNDKAHWSLSSGGAGGACVPFTGDDVVFDANSGFAAGNNTVAVTGSAWCHNMTWTNVAASPVLNQSPATTLEVWGSIVLHPTLTISNGYLSMRGTEASTITTNGSGNGILTLYVAKENVSGGLTFLDNVNFPGLSLSLGRGFLSMADRTMNMQLFNSTTGLPRSVNIQNATITVNYWNLSVGSVAMVNNAAGSFITSNRGFTSNGLTYPRLQCNTTGNEINITNTTITDLLFTSTGLTPVIVALGGNNTIGTMELKGAAEIRGNNTINNLLLAPSRNYNFRNTQIINGLFRFNNPDCSGLGEMRGVAGVATLNFGASSTKDLRNVLLENMTASGTGVPVAVSGADAGGNTGWNFTAASGGARYWVGGSGDWNDAAHWSATSGGAGGACIPTVANDVFFDANSFSSGSSTVTINAGHAYCRNMNWTGAAFAPILSKSASFNLEVWGNLVLNATVRMNTPITGAPSLSFRGAANSTITTNGATLGDFDFSINKPNGVKVTLMDNLNNANSIIEVNSGGLDISGRTVTIAYITDYGTANPVTLNITNATINGGLHAMGANKTVQAAGSRIVGASVFRTNGGVYNKVDIATTDDSRISIHNTTIDDLLFSNNHVASRVYVGGNNIINRLEFKGRGAILNTGNVIDTLIFAPGKTYTLAANTNTTINDAWYGSGSPCNPTQIISSLTTANATVTKTSGTVDFDYVRLNRIAAAGITPFKAREHSVDLGGNVNWDISPYDNSATITGFGPDRTVCADAFPVVLNTDGFFAGPSATYSWTGGSTGKTLSVTDGGTFRVAVQYPDGCTIADTITITKSTVTVAEITGTATVCAGETTTLSSATPGGAWTTSDAAVATVNATGVVNAVAPGTATITYTVTNGDGCTGIRQLVVTVNAVPVVNAITGTLSLFEGGTTTLSNTTPGGVWSSGNTAVATVNNTGVVTGVTGGTADIIYTVTNASGCTMADTVTVTVDGFSPAKRILSIAKTADAQEPSTHGGFMISLPAGILAVEDITVTYTIGGTATAPADYTALSGTAVIQAGQNGVAVPVNIKNDLLIESAETVIATLSAGTSANYAYTISGTAGNATVQIADDDDSPANRTLSVTSQLNAAEPVQTGTFTIALPSGILAPEDITVAYTLGGTATNGTDYQTLGLTAVIPAGQNNVVINVTAIDDQIIEKTETIELTLTGGTTATAGAFTVSTTQGMAVLNQPDNDYNGTNSLLSVTANGNAAEPSTNSSFTISLPTGYTSSLPITVSYTITGTAANGVDYSGPSTTATIPAGQQSVAVPVTVTDDGLIETSETVILEITGGVASEGGTAVFNFSPNPSADQATVTITDDDNNNANRVLSISATNAAEPATNGSFIISLPTGVLASEDITVTYSVGAGTATPGTDYRAITGTIVIPAGQNSVTVPLIVIDNTVIETTETAILNISGGASASLTYTVSPTNGSATATITDNDFGANSNVILLAKVSDAIEGGDNGQYRISLAPGVTSSQDVVVAFSILGTATNGTDYTLLGLSGGNIVIPAGANQVFIDVDAGNDGIIEGPENVVLQLTSAASASHPFTIDPSSNNATVNIIDANAASSTPLQVITGANASEPSTSGSFTVKLAGVATSAWPVTVGYKVSGTATPGIDYQSTGSIVIPPNTNAITVNVNVKDDQIIEPVETMTFTLLSGSATDGGGNAFIFPRDPANQEITVNIADDDAPVAANRVLKVTPGTDASEPNIGGNFTVSLPAGYSSSANTTLSYTMTGSATRNTDYTVFTITLPAYSNSITIPVFATDDPIIEGTEQATINLNGATDGNSFLYSADPAGNNATINILDDDNTPENKKLSVVTLLNMSESGANGQFEIKLPDGIVSAVPITVNYTLGGDAASADHSPLTGTATIPALQNSVTISVSAIDDQVIERTETLTLTVTGGTGGSETYTPAAGSETASMAILDNDNVPANKVLTVTAGSDVTEGSAAPLEFTISLPATITVSEDVRVTYAMSGAALAGTDYTGATGEIVIPAGQNSATVSLPVVDDKIIEAALESVMLTIQGGASASFIFTGAGNAMLQINDNENPMRVLHVLRTADAAEPVTNGGFRIGLPANIICEEDITVNYTMSGTAAGGADYNAITATIVIPAGENGVDVPVVVTDDQELESSETVILTVNSGTSTSHTFLAGTDATVTIADDESNIPANMALSVTKNADAAEPATNGSFTISLPAGITSNEDVQVSYTIGGTAASGADYAVLSGTAIIPAGLPGVTVPVTVTDDQVIEQTETVIITLTGGSSGSFTFTGTGSITIDIADDESAVPGNLALNITKGADGAEPATNGSFTISLPTGITSTEDITVSYTIGGTATAGDDYTTLSGTAIIPAGQPGVSVPVSVTDDGIIESTETVIATLAGGSSASFTFTGTGNATVNITDNDNTPANRVLSITKLNDAAEPSTAGLVNIALPTGVSASEDISVAYTIAGTATADADYAALTGTVLIPVGANSVVVPVSVINDQLIESPENVILTLAGGTSTSFTFTGAGNVSVDIADDDNTPANLVLNVAANVPAGEPDVTGSFTISLPAGLTATEDITVSYAISGTATVDEDYNGLTGLAVIPAGKNSVDVAVNVIDDQLIEGTETVVVEITGGSSTSLTFTPGADKTASLDITDDDADPSKLVLNIARVADGAEPGTNGSFVISLSPGVTVTEDVTVNYTIGGTATAGADYTTLSGSAVIAAGQSSVMVPVKIINDNLIEITETVTATLTGGSSTSFTFTGSSTATVNIADDESNTSLSLSVGNVKDAAEPGTGGTFRISLPAGVSSVEDVTVNYTLSGTATAGDDYTAPGGSAVIVAGQNSVDVQIPVIDDQVIEGWETVVLNLQGGTSTSFTFNGTGNSLLHLADDDNTSANRVLNVVNNGNAAEPGTAGSFTISLPAGISAVADITVNYTITGTATANDDYNTLSGQAVIPAGSSSVSVPVNVIDDQLTESDETVILTITGGNATGLVFTPGASAQATVRIADDDGVIEIAVNATTPAAAEPNTSGMFNIRLLGGKIPTADVTVSYTVSGTATAGTDYVTLGAGTAVIAAGTSDISIPVTVINDELIEQTESVIVTITGGRSTVGTYTVGTANSATVNIADDDAQNLVLEATANLPAAAEPATNGGFTISIAGSKITNEPVTIQYTISGSATAGDDYQAITGTITIPAGQNRVAVPVNVTDDILVEDPETVVLTITGGQSANFSWTADVTRQAIVTITSEDLPQGDLMIIKEIVQPMSGPYRIGQEITYRITVRNIGNGIAGNVVVTDTLPVQLGLPSNTTASTGMVSVATADKVVVWTIGDVTPGGSMQMEVRSRIVEGGDLRAPAEVGSSTTDPDETNNKAELRLLIEGQDLNFPNVFTPNGDGKNERFVIGGIEKYPGSKLQVFNRWGGQVYRSNDYRNDWNGSGLVESTYYYILEVNRPDGVKAYKGWVLIVR